MGFYEDLLQLSERFETINSNTESASTDISGNQTENNTTATEESEIITTQSEIESFFIIRGILAGTVNIEDIVYRDTESYFGILYKDNNRKPICRLNLDTKKKQLLIPDESKNFERIYIDSLNDIYKYKDKLISVVKRYLLCMNCSFIVFFNFLHPNSITKKQTYH